MLGDEPVEASLRFYRFDKNSPTRAAYAGSMFYYPDYAREGKVTLGDKAYKALLVDRFATGDFRGKSGSSPGVMLYLDLNENGKFDRAGEGFDVREPFKAAGQTYEIAGMTASGNSFRIEKSTRVVPEKKAVAQTGPSIAVGKPAKIFKATTTEGSAIDFPASFKGKIVMLDFWAMWCGPCVGELPNLTAAYNKYHAQGFEVLGVSLDRMGDDQKLANFTKKNQMPWAQIFDGKYWQAEVAALYSVHSIPAAYLVDGDTGLVIANTNLRGAALAKTIEAALANKQVK
jgi:thiol-disulfide isomerase/thioredoxin